MLRSSNPVLSRQDAFTPGQPQTAYDQHGYPLPGAPTPPAKPEGRMTLDDVVTKSAILIGLLVISAAAAWVLIPDSLMLPAMIGSGLVGFVVSMVVVLRRVMSPVLAGAFALIEGVFIGMISKYFESFYAGIVPSAVLATFVAAGITLAAYKFLNVRVKGMLAKVAMVGTIAFAGAMLLNFGLAMFGINLGLRAGVTGPVSPLAIIVSAIAVVLCVLNLFLDFQHIENGIRIGAPAKESWRAAFGLTVTMVWLYVEILRILSYFRR
ncbi:Bax inhibitor-1/YccA family protein [Propionibacteriaceae bacterium Y2011]|uniref:Bax inhibitor-1/YccA family protein n=1 Tax=Microlunatus sp. Y2014 TaxID=3418488 RepID=UPI003B486A04